MQIVFRSGCVVLQFHLQLMRFPTSPHACQHLLMCHFDYSHCVGCEVVSHCYFDFHFCNDYWCWAFSMCLLTICLCSSETCLFTSFVLFLNCICPFVTKLKSSLCILCADSLSDVWFANTVFQSFGLSFHFLDGIFKA